MYTIDVTYISMDKAVVSSDEMGIIVRLGSVMNAQVVSNSTSFYTACEFTFSKLIEVIKDTFNPDSIKINLTDPYSPAESGPYFFDSKLQTYKLIS